MINAVETMAFSKRDEKAIRVMETKTMKTILGACNVSIKYKYPILL